jgi:hypothetical protein
MLIISVIGIQTYPLEKEIRIIKKKKKGEKDHQKPYSPF